MTDLTFGLQSHARTEFVFVFDVTGPGSFHQFPRVPQRYFGMDQHWIRSGVDRGERKTKDWRPLLFQPWDLPVDLTRDLALRPDGEPSDRRTAEREPGLGSDAESDAIHAPSVLLV